MVEEKRTNKKLQVWTIFVFYFLRMYIWSLYGLIFNVTNRLLIFIYQRFHALEGVICTQWADFVCFVYNYQLESYVYTQLAEQSINKRAIYVLNQLISCVQSDQLESYVPKSLVYALLWSFAGDAKMKVNNI